MNTNSNNKNYKRNGSRNSRGSSQNTEERTFASQNGGKNTQSKKKMRGGKKNQNQTQGNLHRRSGAGRQNGGLRPASNKSCYLFTQLIGHRVTIKSVDQKVYEGLFRGSQYNPNGGIDVVLDYVNEVLPLSRSNSTPQGPRRSLKFPFEVIVELDINEVPFGAKPTTKIVVNGSEFLTDSEISKAGSKEKKSLELTKFDDGDVFGDEEDLDEEAKKIEAGGGTTSFDQYGNQNLVSDYNDAHYTTSISKEDREKYGAEAEEAARNLSVLKRQKRNSGQRKPEKKAAVKQAKEQSKPEPKETKKPASTPSLGKKTRFIDGETGKQEIQLDYSKPASFKPGKFQLPQQMSSPPMQQMNMRMMYPNPNPIFYPYPQMINYGQHPQQHPQQQHPQLQQPQQQPQQQ